MQLNRSLRSDLMLVVAAMIWGFAFVAQRIGMDYVGPFTYNGVRFALGALVLLPILLLRINRGVPMIHPEAGISKRKIIAGSLLTGLLLFGGVGFQQIGLQYTTAGKAGFITGLYVIFVPIAGIFLGHRARPVLWAGALIALVGLYLLSVTGGFRIEPGDGLVFWCAVIFTFHVLIIAWLSPRMDSYLLAVTQFSICAVMNLIVAFSFESPETGQVLRAWLPIAYGGLLSVGIAYTLQVVAQKTAHPAYASIILSLESVFAVIGGCLILGEVLTPRMLAGCALMMGGMVLVQIRGSSPEKKAALPSNDKL